MFAIGQDEKKARPSGFTDPECKHRPPKQEIAQKKTRNRKKVNKYCMSSSVKNRRVDIYQIVMTDMPLCSRPFVQRDKENKAICKQIVVTLINKFQLRETSIIYSSFASLVFDWRVTVFRKQSREKKKLLIMKKRIHSQNLQRSL